MGRVHVNLLKALKGLELVVTRLGSWQAGGSTEYLEYALAHSEQAASLVGQATEEVGRLVMAGWSPGKRSAAVTYVLGEGVKINDKHRPRYLEIYASKVVDSLVVAKILSTGHVAVRHGKLPPFVVSKSHLQKRGRGDEGTRGRAEGGLTNGHARAKASRRHLKRAV